MAYFIDTWDNEYYLFAVDNILIFKIKLVCVLS